MSDPASGSRLRLTLSDVWVCVAVGLPVISLLLPPLSMIDLAYQVRAGDAMLASHSLLRTDPFTFTAAGTPWLNQQWGAEVVFAAVHRLGGWPLMVLMRALLSGGIFLFVYLACRARGAPKKLSAGLTLGSLALAFPGLILRPQILGLGLFALTQWIVATRAKGPGRVYLVPPIVVLWANLHGSFFLAPLLLALAYIEDSSVRRPSRRVAWMAVASVVAAAVNPFGLRVWSYALGIAQNAEITQTIVEWRPSTVRSLPGALFLISVAVVLLLLARRREPAPWPSLLALGVFFAIGLFAIRGVFWWGLATPAILADLLSMRRAVTVPEPVARSAPRDAPSMANTAFVAMLILIGVVFLPWWRSSSAEATQLLSDAPTGITETLRTVGVSGDHMFNPQIWGSWFEYALPDLPVFVDSRIEVFPGSVWRDYELVSAAADGWQAILDRWRVGIVVADRRQQGGLIPSITRDPGWRLVYEDREGAVFVRTPAP